MRARASIAATLLLVLAAVLAAQPSALGPAERIADGVVLHRLDDPGLLNPAGPIAVQALRLEPDKIRLVMGLAEDRVPARQGVEQIASRHGAIAAVNGGFFALEDGMPNGLLKSGGRVFGGTGRARGAVGITDRRGAVRLLFDRVTATIAPGKNGRRETRYGTRLGTSAKDWARATDAVSGAGLLVLDGRDLTEWKDERLSDVFDITRHPRTMIGVGADGAIWLVTIHVSQHRKVRVVASHALRMHLAGLRPSGCIRLPSMAADTMVAEDCESSVRPDRAAAGQRRAAGAAPPEVACPLYSRKKAAAPFFCK
jgi:hypothetical protein